MSDKMRDLGKHEAIIDIRLMIALLVAMYILGSIGMWLVKS